MALLLMAIGLAPVAAWAQGASATLTTSLVATQGETLTYTAILSNHSSVAMSGLHFDVVLDPNTTLIPGSVNTSPLAFPDTYSALGNVPLTIGAPGVLANDVDPDGVGPALKVAAGNLTSEQGGSVTLSANGGFTYNPPAGFEGSDRFDYTLDDGEGFADTGTVTLAVSGMIWFVNASAAPGGDGRLTSPFNSLATLAAINNGVGNNPAAGDAIYLAAGSYTGPVGLLNNQKLIGQGAGETLAAITGLAPPPGGQPLPVTGGARPIVTGNSGGLGLAAGNVVRGVNFNNAGGTALGGASVGPLVVREVAVANTAGVAIDLAGGVLDVTLDSVAATGGATGIRLVNCTGRFAVIGDGNPAQNGSGGTIQNAAGNGVHLDNVANISLARMNINNSAGNGLFGRNVNGLVLDWCSLSRNGDAVDEDGIRLGEPLGANGLIGTGPSGSNPTRIANTVIRASGEMNVAIYNNGGSLAQLDVTNVVSAETRSRPLGADGFYLETRGNANATVHIADSAFADNFTQGIQASAFAQSVLAIDVANCRFTNNNEGIVLANGNDADLVFDLNNNRFVNSLAIGGSGSAIAVVNATTVTGSAVYSGKVRNNLIAGGGIDNHLVTALLAGAGNDTLQIANNSIISDAAQFSGIFVQAGESGSGNLSAAVTVTGNTVNLGMLGSHGIVVQSRVTSSLCAEIAGNTSVTGGAGLFGINIRQRDTSTFRLPGFVGPFNSTAAVIAFLQANNPGATAGSTVATAYGGGAACGLPLFALAHETRDRVVRDRPPSPTLVPDPQAGLSIAETTPPLEGSRADELTAANLEPILVAARQRWINTGLSREQIAAIDTLRFEVTNLAGWYLGASAGNVVQLDRGASGYGWFIDATPMDDAEFSPVSGAMRLSGRPLSGRIDLLSAVLHEMGHRLGLPDDYTPAARADLMSGFLPPAERRVPGVNRAHDAVVGANSATHYLFASLNLGTLPAGKSITITFRTVVSNPMPPGVCVLKSQGTFTADGGVVIPTDDPRTAALGDATLTTVSVSPVAVTGPASAITGVDAVLNGTIEPCSPTAGYFFEYGTSTAYGGVTMSTSVPAGVSPVAVSAPISGLAAGMEYHFRLVATNGVGKSVGADMVFTTPLDIVQQPTDVAVCPGGTAVFTVGVGSGMVTYQWQRRAAGAIGFEDIPGATADTYQILGATASDDGAAFRVILSSPGASTASVEAFLSVVTTVAPTVAYDFNTGLPSGTAVYGSAFVDAASGVLELNPNLGSQAGAFLTGDLAPGRVVRGFGATFKARLLAGSAPPADGFSFNWASDLPNGPYPLAEEGEGSGLRVCFDTWDNGLGEAPAVDVWWNTNLVARRPVSIPFLVRGPDFFDVQIRLSPSGLLDVLYACEPIFVRLPVAGYVPQMGARFGLGSRTGGAWETHSIDDLALQLDLDPGGLPRITAISLEPPPIGVLIQGVGQPGQGYSLEASTDLVSWIWRANVVADDAGDWRFVESGITTPPYRFYRLRAAPQFPSGLVTWWRADGNYTDSFGPNHGSPEGGMAFAPGQRGQSFDFNGTDSAVFVGGTAIPVPWTAAFWVNRQDTPDVSAALISDTASALKLEQWPSTRQVGFTQFGVADYSFNYITPTNVWTHLALVGTASGTILYANGTAIETNAAVVNLPVQTLGRRDTGTDRLKGALDEITLFNRALSPEEIQRVLANTRGP